MDELVYLQQGTPCLWFSSCSVPCEWHKPRNHKTLGKITEEVRAVRFQKRHSLCKLFRVMSVMHFLHKAERVNKSYVYSKTFKNKWNFQTRAIQWKTEIYFRHWMRRSVFHGKFIIALRTVDFSNARMYWIASQWLIMEHNNKYMVKYILPRICCNMNYVDRPC